MSSLTGKKNSECAEKQMEKRYIDLNFWRVRDSEVMVAGFTFESLRGVCAEFDGERKAVLFPRAATVNFSQIGLN